jgi:hypothetical protein
VHPKCHSMVAVSKGFGSAALWRIIVQQFFSRRVT